ncbi:murein DD-endopeptidase MepM/ murein hydrolase activator NlpD [Brevundimonas vesicularis]|uniref:M23 family metallopeptidase n=1 Tax=Brevundimonas nasdae TaxID=172043 RepID=A0ACD4VH44_9CAUL|nr:MULTISPECIES: M23 family metallopeptidase [Brevundimonas]MDQ1193235.1 murein DD-endopeptidase MepM/ murein hydrolase activator NlpD [Brevundimonas vesicularis]WOB77241.1 M23 family metallopeptidase [Brevundimonas nasdae]
MRRLLSNAPMARCKTLLIHSGQTAAFAAVAVFAAAAAPNAAREAALPPPTQIAAPVSPPLKAEVEKAGPITRQIAFTAPVRGYAINSPFGLRKLAIEAKARAHKGVDIAAPKGTTVFTAAEGEVIRTGYDPEGYGNFIEVRHPNGMSTLYGHLSRIDVANGDAVASGQRIGLVGSTGYSTGPHLHFEVRRGGAQVNPTKVVDRHFEVTVKAKA